MAGPATEPTAAPTAAVVSNLRRLMSCPGAGSTQLVGRRHAGHEGIEGALADPEPEDLLVAERPPRVIDLLEQRVLCRDFGPDLVGSGEARFHHRLRERHQLGAR